MDVMKLPSLDELKASPGLKLIFAFNLAIGICGGAMHFALLWVTLKNRKLRSDCFLLIGVNSLSVLVGNLFVLAPSAAVFVGPLRPTLLQCFLVQAVPLFAIFHIFSLSTAIGLDRLLSAFCPVWYVKGKGSFYLSSLLLASMLFPFTVVTAALKTALEQPNVERLCTIGELLGDSSNNLVVALFGLCCILTSICAYLAVWVRLKRDSSGNRAHLELPTQRAVFASLCAILCVQVCGWALGLSSYALVHLNQRALESLVRWELKMGTVTFLFLAASLDVPVLYATNSEYRKSLRKLLGQQFPFCWRKGNSSNQQNQNHQGSAQPGGGAQLNLRQISVSRAPTPTGHWNRGPPAL